MDKIELRKLKNEKRTTLIAENNTWEQWKAFSKKSIFSSATLIDAALRYFMEKAESGALSFEIEKNVIEVAEHGN